MEAAFVSPFADCIPLKQLRLILKGSNSNPRLPLVNSHKPTHIPKFPNRKPSRLNILPTKIKKLRQALVHTAEVASCPLAESVVHFWLPPSLNSHRLARYVQPLLVPHQVSLHAPTQQVFMLRFNNFFDYL